MKLLLRNRANFALGLNPAHEGLVRPRRHGVNLMCDEFFADPRLARYQYRKIRTGDDRNFIAQADRFRTGAQNLTAAGFHDIANHFAGDASAMFGAFLQDPAAAGRTVEDPWLGVPDITRAYRELGFRPIYPTARSAWRDGAL